MRFSVKHGDPCTQETGCVVAGIFETREFSAAARRLDRAAGGAIGRILRDGAMEGCHGQTVMLHALPGLPCQRVLLVGCGKAREFDEGKYRQVVEKAADALNGAGVRDAAVFLTELEVPGRDAAWRVRHAVEAVDSALYRFDLLKSEKPREPISLSKVALFVTKPHEITAARRAAREGQAVSVGVRLARDLGNLPGNVCTPTYLARRARALQKSHGLRVEVLDEAAMKRLRMGALLSVTRGSRQPAKLIIMHYRGASRSDAPIAFIGKGLTFDAGGISLKPANKMDEMKFDMCGAASVFGALVAAAELRLPLNVVGIVPSSENLPDGNANKPGDIVVSMSGQTIEVLNTDAEGRLILCDAITYAERFKPAVVVDVATLTGACVIALGAHASGVFGNDERLIEELLEAGRYAHDRAWQLPLWEEYHKQLESNFADVANVGGREAGAITGAAFLARFAKKLAWAHLDIAGTAWRSGKEKGATGRPVGLLVQFLLNRARGRRQAARRGARRR